jgi:hypothetical protein
MRKLESRSAQKLEKTIFTLMKNRTRIERKIEK